MSTDARCVGNPISDPEEMLSRVAARPKNKDGGLSIAAFKPSQSHFVPGSADNGGLSTKRPSQPPKAVYQEYLAGKAGRQAIGVFGVTVGEYKQAGHVAGHELPVHDDGGVGQNPAHHASVWYPLDSSLTRTGQRRQHERIAKNVLAFAVASDRCLYRPHAE